MICADNISVCIGNDFLLRDASVSLQAGKTHIILGPNGAGKSTLLKCLTGAMKPNSGQVLLDDKPLSDYDWSSLAKRRAVLSQSNPVNFPFTANEIVMMGRNPHVIRKESREDMRIIDEILESIDSKILQDRLFPTLSGGEQQRIHIARVLAQVWQQNDAMIFLDEPTAALDLKHQHQVLQFLQKLIVEKNWTVVVVIHDLHLARMYGNNFILLKDGKVYACGDAEETLNPANITEVFEVPYRLVAM